MIRSLAAWGLPGMRTEHTGVWVGDAKVAALGVQVTRGFTAHGFALNCDTDLTWFSHIVPCGIANKGVASVSSLLVDDHRAVTVAAAAPVVTAAFAECFGAEARAPVRVDGVAALLASLGLDPAPPHDS
jgi:lipoate-protein ligase B